MRPVLTAVLLAATFGVAGCGKAFAASPSPRPMARPAAQKAAAIRQATPLETAKYLAATPDAQFVDVRTAEEYAEGHAPGATLRTLADLAQWAPSLAKDKPVVLICRSGNRSMKAATALQERGFGTLINVQGGTLGWEDAGLPLDK